MRNIDDLLPIVCLIQFYFLYFAIFRTHIGDPITFDPSITSEQLALKVCKSMCT